MPVAVLAELVTGAPARRFGLPKGRLEPGADADLALVDLRGEHARASCTTATGPTRSPAARCAPASCARCCAGAPCTSDGRVAPGAHGRLLTPDRGPDHERPDHHRRPVRLRGPLGARGRAEDLRGVRGAAAVPPEDHPRALERRVRLDPARRHEHRAAASRTTRATPRRARSCSTPAATARPRSSSPTAARCSRARWASSPATTSSRSPTGDEQLRELGRTVLWEGALDIVFDAPELRGAVRLRERAAGPPTCLRGRPWTRAARGESVAAVQPSPASVAALLLVAAALSLIVLSARPSPPRVDRALGIELDPVEQGERPGRSASSDARRSADPPDPGTDAGPGPDAGAGTDAPVPARAVAALGGDAASPHGRRRRSPRPPPSPRPSSPPTTARWTRAASTRHGRLVAPRSRRPSAASMHGATGYATTLASRPQGIAVERDGSVAGYRPRAGHRGPLAVRAGAPPLRRPLAARARRRRAGVRPA